MGFLSGKRALIIGVASNRSIAYGIAKSMAREGAELAFTYQTDKLAERVKKFATEFDADKGAERCFPCDVTQDSDIDALFTQLATVWSDFDILVHSVGFAPGDQLEGSFVDVTTREGFKIAHDISAYSLTALTRAAQPMFREGASVLTLTYLGSERYIPNYNVMGAAKASLEASVRYLAVNLGEKGYRVNALSAGPIRTLAASGIKNFRKMLDHAAEQAALKKNVTIDEVGDSAAFLCSNLASGITGQTLYVDAGFNITALAF